MFRSGLSADSGGWFCAAKRLSSSLSHELDLLEMRLWENVGLVDETVLMEGVRTHRGHRKPLFFERNSMRYSNFTITRTIADDLDQDNLVKAQGAGNRDLWKIETQMRQYSLTKYLRAHPVEDDTLLLHGDCDEIPARHAMMHAKHCELKPTPIHFRSDFYIFSFWWLTQWRQLLYPTLHTTKDLTLRPGPLGQTYTFPRGKYPSNTLQFPPHSGGHLNRFVPVSLLEKLFKELNMAEGGAIDFSVRRTVEQNLN